MLKKLVAGILALGLVISPLAVLATPPRYVAAPNQRVVIKEKVIQYGDVLRVIGIPITDANTEYHFKTQQLNSCLTDEDAQKIAELVVKLLQDKIAKDGTDTGTTPVPDAESKATPLIVSKCAACHDSKAPEGQINLVTDGKLTFQDMKGKLSPSSVAWYAYEEAFAGHMPKGKPALTDDEVSLLKDYATFLMKKERDDQ